MGFIALLMIPSWPAAFFIIAAIVSIDIGVIGYMSLWGVNLESKLRIFLNFFKNNFLTLFKVFQ